MTAKARLETTLNHHEPDRVPFDLSGTETTSIHITALRNWLALMGAAEADTQLEFFSLVTQMGLVPESVLKKLNVDTRCLKTAPPAHPSLKLVESDGYKWFYDEWGIKWHMPVGYGLYYDIGENPLASVYSIEDLDRFPWPDPSDPVRYERLASEALRIEFESRTGIVLERGLGGMLETATWMRGFENILVDFIAKPEIACRIMDKVLEFKLVYWELALEKVKKNILVAAEADDLGIQESLLISRDMYRKYIKPRHTRLFSHMKKIAPNVKIFYHSCGAIREIIPDLIESGIDILNPIQVSARGMDALALKKEFGDDLVLWGAGVDTQHVLPFGKPQQVRDEVKRNIDNLAPGGGFVFSAVHCIQGDVPAENLNAMWETLQEYGWY